MNCLVSYTNAERISNSSMKLENEEPDAHSTHCVPMLTHHTQALSINSLLLMKQPKQAADLWIPKRHKAQS